MKKRRVLAIPFLLAVLGATVAEDSVWKSRTPRAIVEVAIQDIAEVDALTAAGFTVSHVRGNEVVVHATADDLAALAALGYSYTLVEPQPTPPVASPADATKTIGHFYHTYATFTEDVQAYAGAFPGIARLFTLGQSVQGRELWAMLITDDPDAEEDEPEFKYVSTMHGNESLGTEMCLRFIDLLLNGYSSDPRITTLVDTTAIWIVPLMNPDGLEAGTRENAQGLDLNRAFPRWPEDWHGTVFDGAPLDDIGRPPEVAHVMTWTTDNSFVLSANFHTGALLVNYPYDDDDLPSGADAPTPDDALFEDISRRYSIHNEPMWNSPFFPQGITNGTAWFTIPGGMQDWNYRYVSCNEVTIELSTKPKPEPSELSGFWEDNRESMLSYLEAVHIGIRGIITDRDTEEPLYAQVFVEGNAHAVYTDPDVGDYHRMLLPGVYTLHFMSPGYRTETVIDIPVAETTATRVDVLLALITAADTDVNDDGVVDAVDVQLVINALLGLPVACDCDVDGGGLSATDIQWVINGALGLVSGPL